MRPRLAIPTPAATAHFVMNTSSCVLSAVSSSRHGMTQQTFAGREQKQQGWVFILSSTLSVALRLDRGLRMCTLKILRGSEHRIQCNASFVAVVLGLYVGTEPVDGLTESCFLLLQNAPARQKSFFVEELPHETLPPLAVSARLPEDVDAGVHAALLFPLAWRFTYFFCSFRITLFRIVHCLGRPVVVVDRIVTEECLTTPDGLKDIARRVVSKPATEASGSERTDSALLGNELHFFTLLVTISVV